MLWWRVTTERPLIPFYYKDSWHFWLLYWTCGRLQRLPLELQRGHPSFPAHMDKNKEESLSAMQRLLSKFNHSDNCTYVYQLSHCKINTLSVSIYSLLRTHVDCIMNHSTSISSQPSKQAYLNCVLVSFIVVRITLWSRNLVHDTVVMFIKY